jgi:hypothetical protein
MAPSLIDKYVIQEVDFQLEKALPPHLSTSFTSQVLKMGFKDRFQPI